LPDGRYPGNLAKFCRLTHPGFYFAVKKTYLIPTLFRRAAGCDSAGSVLGDYSFTQNHSSCIRAARETIFRNARQFGAGRASAARTEAT
ncbi:hypothetical protein ACEWFN_34740, partial [Klebsiella quasipneumoniae]